MRVWLGRCVIGSGERPAVLLLGLFADVVEYSGFLLVAVAALAVAGRWHKRGCLL